MSLQKTYIFIDESGDLGVKNVPESSRFIVLTALIFEDSNELNKCKNRIKELKSNLGRSDSFEFKFSKSSNRFRKIFFDNLKDFSFHIIYTVQNKRDFQGNSVDLYFLLFNSLFNKFSMFKGSLYIEIDGKAEAKHRKEAISFLRKILKGRKLKITFANSKNSFLIQAVDMIAGCIRVYHDKSDDTLFKMIKKFINN